MEKAPPPRHTPQRDDDVVESPLDANQRRVRSRFTLSRIKSETSVYPPQSDLTADRRAIISRGFLQRQLERSIFGEVISAKNSTTNATRRSAARLCARALFAANYPVPNVTRAARVANANGNAFAGKFSSLERATRDCVRIERYKL